MTIFNSNYKIVNKFRFFITLCILSVLLSTSFFTVYVNAKEETSTNLIPVYVENGDTLWSLSDKYSGNDTDIRDYIAMVKEINHLNSVVIKPGKLLYFPVDI